MLVYVVTARASAISAAIRISRSVGVRAGPPRGLGSALARLAFSRPPNASEPAATADPIDACFRNVRRSGLCRASTATGIFASAIRAPERYFGVALSLAPNLRDVFGSPVVRAGREIGLRKFFVLSFRRAL